MCGRAYSTYTDEELAIRYERQRPIRIPEFEPNYNMAPTQECMILRREEGEGNACVFERARWGLIPPWARTLDDAKKYALINAKCEDIEQKRSYRAAFRKRRCIVPVSGFFEWKKEGKGRRPFKIFLKDEAIMSLAGVWERFQSERGQEIHSFTIVTVSANSLVRPIHDRMPAILSQDDEEKWLDPAITDPGELKALLRACPSSWLGTQEVSSLVNSAKNTGKEVLDPISA